MKIRSTDILTKMRKKNFLADTSGNFAVITAVAAFPFILALGGAIDVVRITNAKSSLQSAVDAAALSAASLGNSDDVDTVAEEYVLANLMSGDTWDDLEVKVTSSALSAASREIEIYAQAEVPSSFLTLAGISSTTISVTSSASQSQMKYEISMVLDISTSMKGTKLTRLKAASEAFVDEVINQSNLVGLVSVNLIPYGGTVNIKSIFDHYVVNASDAGVITDPSQTQYNIEEDVEDGKFLFSNGESCIESPESDYNDTLIPANSRAQVPHFSVWSTNENPWCPTDETAAIFNSNDVSAIEDRLDEMGLSDGTGSDLGLMWGVKSLSPAWRGKLGGDFTDRPADYDDELTTKIMIYMTDGGVTYQGRPKYTYSSTFPRVKVGKLQKTLQTGSYYSTSSADTAYGRIKSLCEQLDTNGVRVYTIAFDISDTSVAAKQLEDCTVNGGSYYNVDTLNIGTAFDAISSSISNLRVTG